MMLAERLLRLFLEPYKVAALLGDLEEEAERIGASRTWVRREVLRHAAIAGVVAAARKRARIVTTTRLALRDGWRSIWRFKGTTAAAIAILSLSIAAAAVTFAVVDTVVLRPLPYADSDRLVSVFGATPREPRAVHIAPAEYFAWRDEADAFEHLAAWRQTFAVQFKDERGTESAGMILATANLFDVLRVKPFIGNVFTAENEVEGKDAVVVIGYGLWQRRFGGSPDVLGRQITTAAGPATIIGVLPHGFGFPIEGSTPASVWRPYVAKAEERTLSNDGSKSSYLVVLGRLKPGASIDDARAGINRVTASLIAARPQLFTDWRPRTEYTLDALTERVAGWMRLVLAAVVVLMAIGCVNVSNLLLTRSALRTRDISIRSSLGATHTQVMSMLLVESLMLALAGIAAGLVTASWILGAVKTALPAGIPRAEAIALDARVLIACALAATLTAVLSGLVPAWQSSRVSVAAIMKDGAGGSSGRVRRFWQRAFLTTQVALVSALLLASTLLVGSFVRVMRVDLGFARHDLAGVRLNPALPTGPDGEARARDFYLRAVETVRGIPGVTHVTLQSRGDLPLYRRSTTTTNVSLPSAPDTTVVRADVRRVSPEYFEVAGVRMLQGRAFTAAERLEAVVVLDELAASRLFPNGSALGQRITGGQSEETVIGVAANVRLLGPEGAQIPQMYRPISDEPVQRVMLIRMKGDAAAIAPAISTALRSLMPPGSGRVTVDNVDKQFETLTADRRFNAGLMSALGLLALVIGVSGVYATTASLVAQQRREIGIRMALGANASRVVRTVTGAIARLLLLGAAFGLVAGWAASGLLASVVFGISSTDAIAYAIPLTIVVAGGCFAALLPARRAARIDPLITLRLE